MLALALMLSGPVVPPPVAAPLQDAATPAREVEVLRGEAERLRALIETSGARRFLAATSALPTISERVVYVDAKTREALSPAEHAALPAEARSKYQATSYGEDFYYLTRSGSPLAYARMLELIGRAAGEARADVLSGKRILDFGYGGIGHLRLLASLGCDVVGVDVDPLLHAFYRPEDQGVIANAAPGEPSGRLKLVHGRWPAEERAESEVGGGYDLFLSKNTLKRGYVRPAQEVAASMRIDLGVPPEEFLPAVARVLKPGGILALYNLCPAKRTERYIPWAYGESPFTREEFAAAGFELLAFDVDDREQAMELGWALQWDDVENDLFAWYTLARRRP
ncbi:MAG: class I SAM-dependent methyltransferase [Planctomycetes bacterium]|nr:class I SAM-dependent methyltransferase [Planctomycetota bacterium]